MLAALFILPVGIQPAVAAGKAGPIYETDVLTYNGSAWIRLTKGQLTNLTPISATIGGGYASGSGATISSAGIGQFNGALTTDSSLTALSLVIGGNSTFAGTLDPTITNTAAGGDRGINLGITQATNALTGTLDGLYIRATGYGTNSSTGRVQGGEIGARLPDGDATKAAGAVVGMYAWSDAKSGTVETMRTYEASLDGAAGSTATLATAYQAFNNSSGTQTTSVAYDVNEGSPSGRKAFTYDIRGQNGETIANSTNGQWDIGGNVVARGTHIPIIKQTVTDYDAQAATLTIAGLLGGIVTQNSQTGASTATTPTGTEISAGITGAATGDSFTVLYYNRGNQTSTITAGASGVTVYGTAAVPTVKTATLTFICTGANTWSCYVVLSA
jgi:hypothetical protein